MVKHGCRSRTKKQAIKTGETCGESTLVTHVCRSNVQGDNKLK
jgi:hypothetical protein